MRYQIPQFIDVEDKIFGPLTVKQFIYLAGGAGLCVICYVVMPLWLAIVFIAPIGAFSAALAFYKINNKPFVFILEAAFKYILNPKLYIWRHIQTQMEVPKEIAVSASPSIVSSALADSKLKALTFTLDTKQPPAPAPSPSSQLKK